METDLNLLAGKRWKGRNQCFYGKLLTTGNHRML